MDEGGQNGVLYDMQDRHNFAMLPKRQYLAQ